MTQKNTVIVSADALRQATEAIFAAAGLPDADARLVADVLVDTDLNGTHSHGTQLISYYVPQLTSGAIKARPDIRVLRDSGATASVDGDAGMGHVVAAFAMEKAISLAKDLGVGIVTARNSNHFGPAGYYAAMALPHSMIGFATTNCPQVIAAAGGIQPVVGNNPVAYAIPTHEEPPMLLDMAISVVAGARIGMKRKAGERIPLGWALDAGGEPTDDPVAVLTGSLVPIGGYKGFGLAVVMDVLNGILAGAGLSSQVGNEKATHANSGHFFTAIEIDRFVPIDEFRARTDQMIREIHASRKAAGVERVYLPGEIEWERKQARLTAGIPLPASVVEDIRNTAGELGVAVDL